MTISISELFETIKEANQGHILKYWDKVNDHSKNKFFNQLKTIRFHEFNKLVHHYIFNSYDNPFKANLEPVDSIPVPVTDEQLIKAEQARKTGEQLLRDGKVAALLVAGGQGSRLGFDGPKGKFIAGPISRKTLFQLHADKIKAIEKKYNTSIPWLIMTSEENHEETQMYFLENNYLGLNNKNIFFFKQEMIPAVDDNGRIILDEKDHIFTNPNGHGGTLFALKNYNLLTELKERGIEEIFYFQVDNVLIKICDPYFIGYHTLANAEMSAKVVAKRDPYEKVGVIGKINGKVSVIEYSDLPVTKMEARNPDGSLKYNAGNIAIHMFNLDFIEQITSGELNLPYHVAHKKIPYINETGTKIYPNSPNGYKFEMFIFDALPLAEKTVIMEVDRKEEFSPIKNKNGNDSAETAKYDLVNYHIRMLKEAGVDIPPGWDENSIIEISPLFALDSEQLKQKITAGFRLMNGLYLE